MDRKGRIGWILAACVFWIVVAPAQAGTDDVSAGLARLGESSPMIFAGLRQDPEVRAGLTGAWEALDETQREEIAARLCSIDGWQMAPDALAAALGPDLVQELRQRGVQAARAEQARRRLQLALATLSLLPEAELRERGIDAAALAGARTTLDQIGDGGVDPAAAARIYSATFGTLGKPLQQALRGLTDQGLPPEQELGAFRARMMRLLSKLEGLGAEKTGIEPAQARRQRWQIEEMTPPALALLAARTDATELSRIERAAEWWSGSAQPAKDELAHLERVRETVAWLLTSLPASGEREALTERLATADPGTLLVLEGRLAEVADPAALETIAVASSGDSADATRAGEMHAMGLVVEIDPGRPSLPLPDGCGITDPVACIESLVSSAAEAVSSLFNSIGAPVRDWAASVRDFSLGVYQQVTATVEQLPEQTRRRIVDVTRQLLDPVRQQFTPERLAQTLELTEGFWNDLPQAPEIPCPAIGEEIPFFGTVGEGSTAQKYANYLWVFEQVLDIIPDTEISLTVELPAKVAFGGVQYLGRCLEQAAAAVEGEQTEAYRTGVSENLAAEGEQINAASVAIGGSRAQTAQISGQVASWIEQSTSLITRISVEKTLVRPGRGSVSNFQLPERLGGQLETVRALVAATIDEVIQAGLETNDAEQSLESGDLLYERGEYRLAFAAWREAYRRAAKEVSIGNHRLPDPAGKGGVR